MKAIQLICSIDILRNLRISTLECGILHTEEDTNKDSNNRENQKYNSMSSLSIEGFKKQ